VLEGREREGPSVSEIVKFYQQFEPPKNYYDTVLNIQNLTTYKQAVSRQNHYVQQQLLKVEKVSSSY